ncbi:MAG: imidazolonepropionase [Candidatus Thermoplasmatota archaeon]|nr:imidazolonepropionase [Candidatus Thermoplasmatota archaeon]
MRLKVDLALKNCSQLLTLRASTPKKRAELKDLGIICDGTVGIKDGKIVAVGKASELKLDSKKEIDCSNKLVLPGFVDCHTHLVFAGSREKELELKLQGKSYIEILEAGYGIHSTVRATRRASAEELKTLAVSRLWKMLANGTTTLEVKSGYGLDLKNELKCLRVIRELQKLSPINIVPTFLVHAVPLEYKDRSEEYVQLIINKLLPEVVAGKLAEFCDVFLERGAFSLAQARNILKAGKNLGVAPKLHADEFNDLNGAELAAELDCVSADHLLKSNEKGIRELAKKDIIGVLLPGSSFTNFLDYANARKYIELGLPIALATDFNPNCWIDSLGFVIALACYKMKMLPSEAIASSTINAAFAIGKEKVIGSLEAGKKADILVMSTDNYNSIPYRLGSNIIEKVIKSGKVVFESSK